MQGQRFGQRTRAHPGRLELLQQAQAHLQLVRLDAQFFRQVGGQLFQRLGEIAVVVQLFNQEGHHRAVARGGSACSAS